MTSTAGSDLLVENGHSISASIERNRKDDAAKTTPKNEVLIAGQKRAPSAIQLSSDRHPKRRSPKTSKDDKGLVEEEPDVKVTGDVESTLGIAEGHSDPSKARKETDKNRNRPCKNSKHQNGNKARDGNDQNDLSKSNETSLIEHNVGFTRNGDGLNSSKHIRRELGNDNDKFSSNAQYGDTTDTDSKRMEKEKIERKIVDPLKCKDDLNHEKKEARDDNGKRATEEGTFEGEHDKYWKNFIDTEAVSTLPNIQIYLETKKNRFEATTRFADAIDTCISELTQATEEVLSDVVAPVCNEYSTFLQDTEEEIIQKIISNHGRRSKLLEVLNQANKEWKKTYTKLTANILDETQVHENSDTDKGAQDGENNDKTEVNGKKSTSVEDGREQGTDAEAPDGGNKDETMVNESNAYSVHDESEQDIDAEPKNGANEDGVLVTTTNTENAIYSEDKNEQDDQLSAKDPKKSDNDKENTILGQGVDWEDLLAFEPSRPRILSFLQQRDKHNDGLRNFGEAMDYAHTGFKNEIDTVLSVSSNLIRERVVACLELEGEIEYLAMDNYERRLQLREEIEKSAKLAQERFDILLSRLG